MLTNRACNIWLMICLNEHLENNPVFFSFFGFVLSDQNFLVVLVSEVLHLQSPNLSITTFLMWAADV
jgi:hypothetical protein